MSTVRGASIRRSDNGVQTVGVVNPDSPPPDSDLYYWKYPVPNEVYEGWQYNPSTDTFSPPANPPTPDPVVPVMVSGQGAGQMPGEGFVSANLTEATTAAPSQDPPLFVATGYTLNGAPAYSGPVSIGWRTLTRPGNPNGIAEARYSARSTSGLWVDFLAGGISASGKPTVAFFGVQPVERADAYSVTYSGRGRSLGPYAPGDISGSFTGISIVGVSVAVLSVSDGNKLRAELKAAQDQLVEIKRLLAQLVIDDKATGLRG